MGVSPGSRRALSAGGSLAAAAVLLAGCGTGTTATSVGPPTQAASTSPQGSIGGKPSTPPPPVPASGWTDEVITAGNTAYAVGWGRDQSAALWQVGATGALSPRAAPPGMPGNPGLAAANSVGDIAFDTPDTALAITGTSWDNHHAAHKALYLTDDAARTWTKVDLPTVEQPAEIALGHGAAYALTSNCPRPRAACDHATLWSIDPTGRTAPRTFDTLPTKTGTSGPITLAAYGPDVWVFLNLGAGPETALHSDDGGSTWHRFDGGLCTTEKPRATSANVLWATCSTGMMEHFTRQHGDVPPATVFYPVVGGTTSSSLHPLSDTTAYAIIDGAHGARVQATHDGGRTVHTVAQIPRSIARRGFQDAFVTQQVGYLVTLNGGQLYRTVDGARSWHQVNPPQP